MATLVMHQQKTQSQSALAAQRARISKTLLAMRNGKSLRGLARELGVNHASLNDWIAGKRTPDNESIQKIARKSGVTIDWLLHGKETPFHLGEALEGLSQVQDIDQLLLIQDRFTKAIASRVREIASSYSCDHTDGLQN